ncbi:alpha/beta hydrolase [soil metagenome]
MTLAFAAFLMTMQGPSETLKEAWALPVKGPSTAQIRFDPVEAAFAHGEGIDLTKPLAGQTWKTVSAGEGGVFTDGLLGSGILAFQVASATDRTVFLEAQGASQVWVNGEPRVGDVYSTEYVSLPVRLHQGENLLLFRVSRGRLKVSLAQPERPVSLDARDATMPDRIRGRREFLWAALVVRNATETDQAGYSVQTISGGRRISTALPPIPALGVRKAGFRIPAEAGDLQIRLLKNGREVDRKEIKLRVREPRETRKRTFLSGIDGSVQYYAENPASRNEAKALVLSVHGAGVEAIGQADAYSSKAWANIVCPTNRRPYGFDWEDWGREDALEVLDLATAEHKPDPARIYLTGHSMGGHGAWHLGTLYPDRFGAVAPCSGWASSFGYAGVPRGSEADPLSELVRRAGNVGDTTVMIRNLGALGVYILHGDADDTVPVSQAREMAKLLEPFHHDWTLKEVPGQSHWYDLNDEPGADAVDYAPLFDFLARHARPSDVEAREVDFSTFNPGVSAKCHWATIDAQEKPFALSTISLRLDPFKRRIVGTTENVRHLTLDLSSLEPMNGKGVRVELDGQALALAQAVGTVTLQHERGVWAISSPLPATWKNPARSGPFRMAFGNRMMFVYGTGGTPEENAWSFQKARYDAELFWYRGNGSVDVVADRAFDVDKEKDRSVILYGNADTNRAWKGLLAESPVQVGREEVTVGGHKVAGKDLACLFERPRAGSDRAYVGVVGWTGVAGGRVANGLNYLQPMLGFPDLFVANADALTKAGEGVLAAGFFGEDWSVDRGEFAFK